MIDARTAARLLGGDASRNRVLCPTPGHSPKDRSLSVLFTPGGGFVVNCFAGDDWRACHDFVRERLGLPRDAWKNERPAAPRPPKPPDDDRANAAKRRRIAGIIAELRPIRGTDGEAYLRKTRRIDTESIADVLERADAIGWHAAVYFNEPGHELHGQRLGAIIGVMTDAVTARPSGAISRTYLHNGRKLCKAKTLGRPLGVIRLSEDVDVLSGLGLAEGLESALSALARGFRPVWSTGGKALMAAFPVLPLIERLTLFADNDPNGGGLRAAQEAQARWFAAGREARVFMTAALGDINDLDLRDGGNAP
jgi:hypothetical protein